MVSATLDNYLEGSIAERITILVMVTVVLGIVAFGVFCAANTLWRLFTLPAKLRERKPQGTGVAVAASAFEIVIGIGGFAICFAMTVVVLLFAESLITRKGGFSGAGAAIVWPMPR
jgi:hypothetical protein